MNILLYSYNLEYNLYKESNNEKIVFYTSERGVDEDKLQHEFALSKIWLQNIQIEA